MMMGKYNAEDDIYARDLSKINPDELSAADKQVVERRLKRQAENEREEKRKNKLKHHLKMQDAQHKQRHKKRDEWKSTCFTRDTEQVYESPRDGDDD